MGKGSAGQSGVVQYQVKNTFLDVVLPDDMDEDGFEEAVFEVSNLRSRQVSAPAGIGKGMRQISSGGVAGATLGQPRLDEEPESEDELGVIGDMKAPNRQETEHLWPCWCPVSEGNSPTHCGTPMVEPALTPPEAQTEVVAPASTLKAEATPFEPLGSTMATADDVPPMWQGLSTVMMRNLPNKYTQAMLLEELDNNGFMGMYDFAYLPIDPETHANKGYAFLNFIDPAHTWLFAQTFEGRKLGQTNSHKTVTVRPAEIQGFEANYAHFSSARVSRGDPAARPLFLRSPLVMLPTTRRSRRGGRKRGSLIDKAALPRLAAAAAVCVQQQMALSQAPQNQIQALHQEERNLAIKFCPYCGEKAAPDFKFCQYCGESLSER